MAYHGNSAISRPRSWGSYFPPVARVQIVIIAALLVMVYWTPIRRDLVWRWLNDGNWSHGPLVPLFSLYFLVTRREELFRSVRKTNYLGAVVLAASLVLYFLSVWRMRMAYPQALSLLGAAFGTVLLFGGWQVMRTAWFPIAYLLFAIPLPQGLYIQVTMPLRQLATFAAAKIMPLFVSDLHVRAQSVVIDYMYQGKRGMLNVEEACSGMRLMVSFVALGVAMAYLGVRPAWQRVVMVISCVPIAVFCNTLRVTITGLLQVGGYEDLTEGTPHQLLGIAMLAIALGLFALIGYILSNLLVEEPQTDSESVEIES